MSTTGKSADLRSRRLLDIGQVVEVKIERGPPGSPPDFIAVLRMPFHWTDNEGKIKWGMIPDVHMSAPVAIGDMVLLETIGRGFSTTYLGSPAIQPMPLHRSGLVSNPVIQTVALGPGGAVQWYRKLGAFSIRGESSAFIASASFDRLTQFLPEPAELLPETAPVGNPSPASAPVSGHSSANLSGVAWVADLTGLKAALEGGLIHDAIPCSIRLAALGPYDEDDKPVGPTDAGAAWIDGEVGAGETGAIVNPGHFAVVGNPDYGVSFDAAFDVGPDGAGKTYDLYLVITPESGTPTYRASALRLNVLEANWNTDYLRTGLII